MTNGYKGKILRVNLGREKTSMEEPQDNFYRQYFGGRGLIGYYLLKELEPGVDPLKPDNKLIFACGPITGAPLSGCGRNSVGAKSPLTGGYGEAEVGGFWGTELKHAGFDAIIVEDRATRPVYLWIHEQQVETRDAGHIWDMEIRKSQDTIRSELGDKTVRIAQIGPRGEKIPRYASIINDMNHVAGRCGMGAVMGSKNLKAIAVKGSRSVDVAHPEELKNLRIWMSDHVKDQSTVAARFHAYGTGSYTDAFEQTGNLPVNNFRDGEFPNVSSITAQTIKETVSVGMETCFACVIACKKMVKVEEPWIVDPAYGGPEYETIAALGSNCGIHDLKAICKANELCQRYSLDTISTGASIAFAMECFEKGLITDKDTGGIQLHFGNVDAMLRVVDLIARREGIGSLLAEGVKRAAKKIGKGAEKFAVHVKGLEIPMHEPRLKKSLGLGYCIAPHGADHQTSMHDTGLSAKNLNDLKSLGVLEPVSVEDFGPKKVRLFIYYTNWEVLDNCLVMCQFVPWSYAQIAHIVNAVTGWNTTEFELAKVSERATNLTRVFNIREGLTVNDDWLPDRFFHPKTSGPLSRTAVDPKELSEARRIYYGMMGWNEESGVPTHAKLSELDISWAAEYLGLS